MMGSLQAQIDTVSIQQIQTVSAQALATCVDTSAYLNDTVWTYGVVMMSGELPSGETNSQANNGENLWIQNGTGPYSGLDMYKVAGINPDPVIGTEMLDLQEGDSIMVKGIITRFGRETEIVPLEIQVIDFDKDVVATPIDISDLNDANRINQLPTGEQWEGAYVEIYNAAVVSVDPFTANGVDRVSFNVSDGNGNLVNISDRFIVQRQSNALGDFVPPTTSTIYDTLRGVIAHSANGCTGAGGRGYEMYPFRKEDYVLRAGTAGPQISGITRSPLVPTSGQDVTIFATINDPDGTVDTATLFYTVGISNTNFFSVGMSANGSTYSGVIPASIMNDGDFVKYYICATDNDTITACNPDVPATIGNPEAFFVRDNGLTIYDLQFTPYNDGNSLYRSRDVTVRGVITAASGVDDLGFVYLQQPGATQWAGISLVQNQALSNLTRGDSVEVSGTVQEDFGFTRMAVLTVVPKGTANSIPEAVELNPDLFNSYDFAVTEAYEGMLVKYVNPNGGGIFIVEENADAGGGNNFAEYRIGTDPFVPTGSRAIAGRDVSSSLYVSYVNDSIYISGNVDACLVTAGDSMASVSGILAYTFGNPKLLPRNNADFEAYSGANCPDGISNIEDELAGTEINAYPNPTQGQLTVSYDFPKFIEAEVRLMDLTGRTLVQQKIRGLAGETNFSLDGVAGGTYVLMVSHEGYIVDTRKIVLLK